MRARVFVALLFSWSLMAQPQRGFSGAAPRVTGSFGSVLFPGGTSAIPGVHRIVGSAVFPGNTGPRLVVPGTITDPTFGLRLGATVGAGRRTIDPAFGTRSHGGFGAIYAYPVYVPAVVDPGYYYSPDQLMQQAPQQPANITIIYPPQQAAEPQAPEEQADAQSNFRTYQAPYNRPAPEPVAAAPRDQYLLAFKDHNIYAALAYWVDGDTLHYFTSGNKHNQASLSFVDRALTDKLNKESGVTVDLPPAK